MPTDGTMFRGGVTHQILESARSSEAGTVVTLVKANEVLTEKNRELAVELVEWKSKYETEHTHSRQYYDMFVGLMRGKGLLEESTTTNKSA